MQHHTCAQTELCTFTAFPGVIFKFVFLVPEQVGSTAMAAASGKTKFHNSVLSDNIDWIRKSLYGETLDLKCCYKQVCIYKHQRPRLWRPVIVIKDKTTEHGSWAGLPSVPSRKQWKYTPCWPCHTSPQSPILASLVYWLRYKYLSLIWKILETITPNFSPTTSCHEPCTWYANWATCHFPNKLHIFLSRLTLPWTSCWVMEL